MKKNKGVFKKGHIPWNKNKKGIHLSKKSEFKKGKNTGEKHPSWKGGIQKCKRDCVHIWVGPNVRLRRPRMIYEDAYGKIPKGYVIYHRNGNKNDDRLHNLIAMSRAELLEWNRRKND